MNRWIFAIIPLEILFVYQEAKVGVSSLIWETLSFTTAWFLVFSGFIWDGLKVKFGFLCQIFQWISLPNACALVLQVLRKLYRREKCLSIQKDVFCIFESWKKCSFIVLYPKVYKHMITSFFFDKSGKYIYSCHDEISNKQGNKYFQK